APRSPAVTVRLTLAAATSAAVIVCVTGCAKDSPPSSSSTVSPNTSIASWGARAVGFVGVVRLSKIEVPPFDPASRRGGPAVGAAGGRRRVERDRERASGGAVPRGVAELGRDRLAAVGAEVAGGHRQADAGGGHVGGRDRMRHRVREGQPAEQQLDRVAQHQHRVVGGKGGGIRGRREIVKDRSAAVRSGEQEGWAGGGCRGWAASGRA